VDDTLDLEDAINDEQYFEFRFTVAGLSAGEALDISSFSYTTQRNANSGGNPIRSGWGHSQLTWRTNSNSAFSARNAAGSVNIDPDVLDLDSFTVSTDLPSDLLNGDLVFFRLYVWGSDSNPPAPRGPVVWHSATRLGGISILGETTEIIRPHITDVSHSPASGSLRITWNSRVGMLYALRSSSTLSADLASWPVFNGLQDIVATPPRNSLVFPLAKESERFFVIEESRAPQ
jgi:hypothetical protein